MTASRAARLQLAVLLLMPGVIVPALLAQSPPAAPAQLTFGQPLTVMSFNIRYGTANDGENHWTERRNMLFDVVREQDADLIGLQEALDFQIAEIVAAAPAYGVVGVGRDDGAAKGEYSAILFRKSRLHVAEAGTFWFSDTPSVPGSRSWGNNITRICTWARFIDRDGRGFYVYNVHLDHQSQPSRERSTLLLRERVESRSVPVEPVVIAGDFNVGEDNPALATLIRPAAGQAPFVDTFRVVRPDEQPAGTFTGFKLGNISGPKIDYVLVQPGTEVERAEILRYSRHERYPSDHFPVVARVRLVWGERNETVPGDR
jgi:endonuclease/exonuclease/phosphatase family metal-dependent hydrolase